MTTLDQYSDAFARPVVAYAFEVAKFHISTDPDYSDRQLTDWSWYVQRDKPSEDDWEQTDTTAHRIRNVTPLVRGSDDNPDVDALAFEYEYIRWDGEVKTTLDTDDPRGSDALIRCTPLVAKQEPDSA